MNPNIASTPTRAPRIFPLTEARLFRLSSRVALADAARLAAHGGMSITRASLIERDPTLARPGELDALRAGVVRAAAGGGAPLP